MRRAREWKAAPLASPVFPSHSSLIRIVLSYEEAQRIRHILDATERFALAMLLSASLSPLAQAQEAGTDGEAQAEAKTEMAKIATADPMCGRYLEDVQKKGLDGGLMQKAGTLSPAAWDALFLMVVHALIPTTQDLCPGPDPALLIGKQITPNALPLMGQLLERARAQGLNDDILPTTGTVHSYLAGP